jgi:hypothetical protein
VTAARLMLIVRMIVSGYHDENLRRIEKELKTERDARTKLEKKVNEKRGSGCVVM